MNTTTLQDEKSIDELARRVYVIEGRGGAKKLERAREALVKENPQLRDFSRIKKGAKINIPEISDIPERKPEVEPGPSRGRVRIPTREPGPRPAPKPDDKPRPDRGRSQAEDKRASEGEIPDPAAGLRASVAALEGKLARADEEILARTERQLGRLSDARFRNAAKKNPRAGEVSKKLEASLNQRRKELQAGAEARQKAFEEIEEDLGEMGRWVVVSG